MEGTERLQLPRRETARGIETERVIGVIIRIGALAERFVQYGAAPICQIGAYHSGIAVCNGLADCRGAGKRPGPELFSMADGSVNRVYLHARSQLLAGSGIGDAEETIRSVEKIA